MNPNRQLIPHLKNHQLTDPHQNPLTDPHLSPVTNPDLHPRSQLTLHHQNPSTWVEVVYNRIKTNPSPPLNQDQLTSYYLQIYLHWDKWQFRLHHDNCPAKCLRSEDFLQLRS